MIDIRSRIGNFNLQLLVIFAALSGFLITGTIVYHHLEGWSWTTSFYFTVCTITTIGYGDVVPSTDTSRLFTAVFALSGVSVALASFGIIGANYLRRGQDLLEKMRSMK
jgi:voltage-gated potassium channel